jgi:hypothetical protein
MFRIQIFAGVDDPYTSAEVLYGEEVVAIVYERPNGWKVDLYTSPRGLDLDECLNAIGAAKTRLLDYVNRRGENQPEGLTAAGLSLWRMERADRTAMGIKLPEQENGTR